MGSVVPGFRQTLWNFQVRSWQESPSTINVTIHSLLQIPAPQLVQQGIGGQIKMDGRDGDPVFQHGMDIGARIGNILANASRLPVVGPSRRVFPRYQAIHILPASLVRDRDPTQFALRDGRYVDVE